MDTTVIADRFSPETQAHHPHKVCARDVSQKGFLNHLAKKCVGKFFAHHFIKVLSGTLFSVEIFLCWTGLGILIGGPVIAGSLALFGFSTALSRAQFPEHCSEKILQQHRDDSWAFFADGMLLPLGIVMFLVHRNAAKSVT